MPHYDHLRQFNRSSYDYPHTGFFIESPNHWPRPSDVGIEQVVIHITGGPAMTESSAINRFLVTRNRDGDPQRVSAHYIVNRQGLVVQMVRDNQIANHIRNRNYYVSQHSIGIEHVNPWNAGNRMQPTTDQYLASAGLVVWLCFQHNIPFVHNPDPRAAGIKGHNEGDPRTGHSTCPTPAWDWDRYMSLLGEVIAAGYQPPLSLTSTAIRDAATRFVGPVRGGSNAPGPIR